MSVCVYLSDFCVSVSFSPFIFIVLSSAMVLRANNSQSFRCPLTATRALSDMSKSMLAAGTSRLTLGPCSGPDREAQRKIIHTRAVSTQQPLGGNCPEWEMTKFRLVCFFCCCLDFDPRSSGKLKLLRSFSPLVILLARPFAQNSVQTLETHTGFISLASDKCFQTG